MSAEFRTGDLEARMVSALQAQLNEAITRAAEPIVKQAMVDVERAARERMGALLIAHIDKTFSVQRMGVDLVITVRGAVKP